MIRAASLNNCAVGLENQRLRVSGAVRTEQLHRFAPGDVQLQLANVDIAGTRRKQPADEIGRLRIAAPKNHQIRQYSIKNHFHAMKSICFLYFATKLTLASCFLF